MKAIYRIYVNGVLADETVYEGLAHIKAESGRLLGCHTRLVRAYLGGDYDPVLHRPQLLSESNAPPCPAAARVCPYRKEAEAWATTTRPTALRVETMEPAPRCGWLLMPDSTGGAWGDYGRCIV